MPGERRPVLDPRLLAVPAHPRQAQEHHEPGRALDERADRGAAEPEDQVAFPMAGHGPVGRLGGPLADHDLRPHEALAAFTRASARHPQRAPRAQAGRQLAAQRAAALHVERLVDRLVRDPHRGIIGKVDREPVRDLLRAPRARPAPILAATVAAADPTHRRPGDAGAVRHPDRPRESLPHVAPQPLVGCELGRLRPTSPSVGVPLRRRGAVLEPTAAGRGVPPQLARDRRRRTTEPPRDLPHARAAHAKQRDLFTLTERQVAARRRPHTDRWHPATLAEPPDADPATASEAVPHDPPHDAEPLPSQPSSSRRCEDHLNPPSTPRSRWAACCATRRSWRAWAPRATPGTTPAPKAASRRSRTSSSSGARSRRETRRGAGSSATSRPSTTHSDGTRAST